MDKYTDDKIFTISKYFIPITLIVGIILIIGLIFKSKLPIKNNLEAVDKYMKNLIEEEEYIKGIKELETAEEISNYLSNNVYNKMKLGFEGKIYTVETKHRDNSVDLFLKDINTEEVTPIGGLNIDSKALTYLSDFKLTASMPIVNFTFGEIKKLNELDKYKILSYKGDKVVTFNEEGGPYIHEYRIKPKEGVIYINKFK